MQCMFNVQSNPPGRQNAAEVAVREDGDIAFKNVEPRNHPVSPQRNLGW